MSDIDDDSAELHSRENVYSLSLLKLRGQFGRQYNRTNLNQSQFTVCLC